jgi:hypothetical protein
MMVHSWQRRVIRRLIAAALILSLTVPSTVSVGRADDEPVTPEISQPSSDPMVTPTSAATATPAAATPGATRAATPAPGATPNAQPKVTPAADQRPTDAQPQPALSACPLPGGNVEPTAWHLEGNDAVNNMRDSIASTFRSVEARDLGVTGQFVGFRPGALYAHVYARDSATIAPTAQYFYDLPYLTRPVEEFLALQYDGTPNDAEDAKWKTPSEPGAVSGTIGGGEVAGAKMLVVSDEEPSVISMAYVAVKAGAGAAWLKQNQAGRPRVDRLNEAMDWLFANRFDQDFRAIKRGNTTDWGDVVVGQGLTSGSYVKEPDDWTLSMYDQAWTYRALVELAELNRLVGQPDIADHQIARARLLRQTVAERFWQPQRGYFRTRIPLPPLLQEIDEDGIVSIANGVAVYSGITEPQERKPIFQALEAARQAAGAPKPGLSLWPPYPTGFFDYPQMVPGRYQNGAVWDWWGGMQLSAEFWNGSSALGRQHLDMVAKDWAREPGEVYEWQDMYSHVNSGSQAYAGAAATMGEAIISGLFGVELGPQNWTISPRLGAQSGSIHVYHPPSGCTLDYSQSYSSDKVTVDWDTEHPNSGDVRVLLPDNVRVTTSSLDQKPVTLKIEVLGDDSYAVLPTTAPSGKHRLEIGLTPKSDAALTP